jgi:hypothetical protein
MEYGAIDLHLCRSQIRILDAGQQHVHRPLHRSERELVRPQW